MAGFRLSAHIGYLFRDRSYGARFAAAAAAGFHAVEHPFPSKISASETKALLQANGLHYAHLSCCFGDGSRGEKGIAALSGRQAEFRAAFDAALDFACLVEAPLIHPMAGIPDPVTAENAKGIYRDNLAYAVERAAGSGIRVMIEPISQKAVPRYALGSFDQACRLQDEIGVGNLWLLLDTFHAAACGLDPVSWIAVNHHRIAHVHVADFPGRQEPGTGSLDFGGIRSALRCHGFAGSVGFEFNPSSSSTHESLAFLKGWQA